MKFSKPEFNRREVSLLLGSAVPLSLLPLQACVEAEEANSTIRANLYQCEGCEGVYERPEETLTSRSVMVSATEPGEPLVLTGTVFATDGRTAVPGVILYAYQTNAEGLYANGTPETEWSLRHGNIRGWVKTGADGRYEFETIKPAPYPKDTMPAHIHLTVLEEGKPPYWIDDVVFTGEFGVTDSYRNNMVNQGGNGIVSAQKESQGIWRVTRDIYLEPHP